MKSKSGYPWLAIGLIRDSELMALNEFLINRKAINQLDKLSFDLDKTKIISLSGASFFKNNIKLTQAKAKA